MNRRDALAPPSVRWPTWFTLLALFIGAACGPPGALPAQSAVARAGETIEAGDDALPPSSPTYATDPVGAALLGGPLSYAAERELTRALGDRGDHPVGDGRLALLAQWAARRAARGITIEPALVDAVARRIGYVGPTPWVAFFPCGADAEHPVADADLQRVLAAVPSNVPVTRYGLATLHRGAGQDVVAVALNSLEVTLRPIPKRFAVNDTLRLSGKVGDRFVTARLAITLPDGKVRTWGSASRAVTSEWAVTKAGVHRVELLGDGASGPVVVANFPI